MKGLLKRQAWGNGANLATLFSSPGQNEPRQMLMTANCVHLDDLLLFLHCLFTVCLLLIFFVIWKGLDIKPCQII